MIKISIVEDSVEDYQHFHAVLQNYLESAGETFCVTHYTTAVNFLEDYHRQFQLIFMDIDLPGMNGLDAARALRRMDQDVTLVFLTNLAHFAINGYEVDAIDYMLKPVDASALALKMPKVLKHIKDGSSLEIHLNTKNSLQRLQVTEIRYVEVVSHQLCYHTSRGDFYVWGTMRDAEEQLQPHHFYRCNQGYLVNLAHVSCIEGNDVRVGSDLLPISRPRKKAFINALTNYLGGMLK